MAATVAGGGGLFVGEDSVFSFLFCPFWFLGVSGRTPHSVSYLINKCLNEKTQVNYASDSLMSNTIEMAFGKPVREMTHG